MNQKENVKTDNQETTPQDLAEKNKDDNTNLLLTEDKLR
jgi:hypothetical protein